jgi:hypothetical protein
VTTPLPPGRERRGQLLLTGKLDPRDAHPLELAFATQHILTHPSLDADAFRRSHEEVALAEVRASLHDLPRRMFGLATLKAVHARLPETECRRCRALMLARVYRLRPPGFDAATNYLIGPGCDRCRPKTQPTGIRAGGAAGVTPASAASRAQTRGRVAAAFGYENPDDLARDFRRDVARMGAQRAAEKWGVPVRLAAPSAAPSRRTIVPGFDPILSFRR